MHMLTYFSLNKYVTKKLRDKGIQGSMNFECLFRTNQQKSFIYISIKFISCTGCLKKLEGFLRKTMVFSKSFFELQN